jgi:subtilisin family serine protease
MKNKYLSFITLLLSLSFIVSCNKKDENLEQNINTSDILQYKISLSKITGDEPMKPSKLDAFVKQTIQERNDFRWEWVDAYTLWSAAQYGENTIAIGYQPANYIGIDKNIHTIDIQSRTWKEVHDALIKLIIDKTNKNSDKKVTWEEIVVEDDAKLPILIFKSNNKEVITELYNLKNVRYIEPMDYWPIDEQRSSSGCSGSTYSLNSADWVNITPGCRMPWNFINCNVPDAWNLAQGQGITVGIIDAGISSTQNLLGTNFNNGSSASSRTITTDFTLGNSAFTSCTHGTSMSGIAVGPRNNLNASTGVAYKSNLHFIRACNDVVLDASSERTAVKNALVRMGDKISVRIISMSIGTPFSSGVLEDGVNYAYNKGKMIFAAAGTSFSWTSWWGVIYPAALTNCIAVTGVQEGGNTCETCHDGSEVDFTIPMERTSNTDRNTLSLSQSGNTPSYVGGSSCATATAAGIAALVWSARPSLTREQVYFSLRNTSQFYPSVSTSKGYGNLNAVAAVNAGLNY